MANGRNKSGDAVLEARGSSRQETPKVSRGPSKAELEAKAANISEALSARLRMRQRDDRGCRVQDYVHE